MDPSKFVQRGKFDSFDKQDALSDQSNHSINKNKFGHAFSTFLRSSTVKAAAVVIASLAIGILAGLVVSLAFSPSLAAIGVVVLGTAVVTGAVITHAMIKSNEAGQKSLNNSGNNNEYEDSTYNRPPTRNENSPLAGRQIYTAQQGKKSIGSDSRFGNY